MVGPDFIAPYGFKTSLLSRWNAHFPSEEITLMLMEDAGKPRTRKWVDDVGFVNLFQGRDLKPQPNGDFYPGIVQS